MHDTASLRRACQRDPFLRRYFLDVYGADQVPCQAPYPRCAIANTDPIDLPVQHWVGLFWKAPDQGEFFDSYAIRPQRFQARWQFFEGFEQAP